MSTSSTPNDSPVPIESLHRPELSAHVVVPQAPLGNVANQGAGMGAKALLAKKMAKNHNPAFISPTDNLMTPCTQKLSATKKKHFTKGTKPVQLFAQKEEESNGATATAGSPPSEGEDKNANVDEENPF